MASVMTRLQFIPTARGGRKLSCNGYTFRINRKREPKSWWVCCTKECPARITTENDVLVSPHTEHSHPPNLVNASVLQVMSNIRKRARDEITPMPTIYTEEISRLRSDEAPTLSTDVASEMPTFVSVKSGLYQQRQKTLPPIPKSRDDIELEEPWTLTNYGEEFVLANDGTTDRIIMFGTLSNLRHLCNVDKFFCDGTFYASPKQFKQIYSIHALVHGQMMPLVFCLLPDKKQETYTRMFRLLKDAATARGLTLSPSNIQLDFETAVHNAAIDIFPEVDLKGCLFHYTQCIWRKVQALGMTTSYQSDVELYQFIRRAAALPLVPVASVDDVWLEALAESPDTGPARLFADYITETWVEGFDKKMWNHFETEGPRTTNHLEGWHSKLNRLIKKAHPNLFEFVTVIKMEQAANEVKVLQLENGAAPPLKKRKYRTMEDKLNRLKGMLSRQEKSLLEYTDAAAHLLSI